MVDFKLTVADPKTGKCVQREFKDETNSLLGKKIGDKIEGSMVGLADYEFELTGGSDYCGFPMRKDVQGTGRKRILAVHGTGIRKKARGIRQRKTVCGNTIHDRIVQVNLKILKQGKEKLFKEGAGKEAEEKGRANEKKGEKKEGKKEAPKEPKEEKKEGKKEAPKEPKKE